VESALQGSRWWRRLRRQRRWLLGSLLGAELCVAVAIAVLPPVYGAHMSLELNPPRAAAASPGRLAADALEARETTARQLQSRPLLGAVAAGLGLERRPEYAADPAGELLRHLEVDPVRDTRVVEVHFTAADPQLAAAVLAQLAARYQRLSRRQAAQAAAAAADRLAPELAAARQQLWSAQQAQATLAARDGVDCGDPGLAAPRARLEQVEQARTQAAIDLDRATAAAREPDGAGGAPPELATRAAELRSEIERLATQYGPEAPQLVRARAALASVVASLAAQRLELGTRLVMARRVQASLLAQLQAAGQREREQLTTALRAVSACNGWAQQAEAARQLGAGLLREQGELRVAAETAVPDLRLLDPPQTPLRPERPRPLTDFAFAGLLGLGLGTYLAWWRDVHSSRFWLESGARETWPLLGCLPDALDAVAASAGAGARGVKGVGRRVRNVRSFGPQALARDSRFDSALRQTATRLYVAGRQARHNVLALTSLAPSLDAPTPALAVARALSGLSASVVMVSAGEAEGSDLLRDPEAGMFRDALAPKLLHLPVLSHSPSPPPAWLRPWLQSQKRYEWVLLDLPGLEAATPLLDERLAAVLLVPDGGVPRHALHQAWETLAALATPCLGMIVHGRLPDIAAPGRAAPGSVTPDSQIPERSRAQFAGA